MGLTEQQQVLLHNLTNLQNGNLCAMASLSLLLWDSIITLDREIQYVWVAKRTLGTWLYILNRWVPIISNLLHIATTVISWSTNDQLQMCIPILYTVGILTSVSFTIVQVVVSLRTYALYDCNKPLLAALLILSGASLINLIYWSTGSHHIVPNHLPAPYNGCLMIADHYDPQWARYIPLMVFEGVVMFLTTVKFMIYLRSRTPSIIPAILYRDGYMGFIAILISNLFGLIILSVRPRPLITVSQMCAPILAPVLITNHMLLNLRDVMRLSTPPSEGASNLFELDTNSSPEAPTQVFSFDLSTDHAVVESKPLDIRQSGYYNQASFPGDRPTARHRAREVQLPTATINGSSSFDGVESWNQTP